MIAVQVIAAETDAEARRLFTTPQQRFLRLIRNQPVERCPQSIPWSRSGMTGSGQPWRTDSEQRLWDRMRR